MALSDLKRMLDIWGSPADYNRAARRQVGLYGRFWKWDAKALGFDPNIPPRYVRRHHTADTLTNPKNRRERRHKARILRAMRDRL